MSAQVELPESPQKIVAHEVAGAICQVCHKRKREMQPFCTRHMHALPMSLRAALTVSFGAEFVLFYEEAKRQLEAKGRTA